MDEVSEELMGCCRFELGNDVQDIDDLRLERLEEFVAATVHHEAERKQVEATADDRVKSTVCQIHIPLWRNFVLPRLTLQDPQFCYDLLQGFPYVGDMPLLDYYVKDKKLPEVTEVEDLVKHRYEWNQATFDSLKSSDCEDEMLVAAQDEAEKGWTWPPRPVQESDWWGYNWSRRIGVWEWREHLMKMRLRNVDDGTASGVNPATGVYQTMQCDGIDVLVFIVLLFLNSAVMPWLWKADIKSAFRRCPLRSAHQQFAAVVFLVAGVPHIAVNKTLNFGATASVHGWHRVSSALLQFMRIFFRLVVCRYVDDYFGVTRSSQLAPSRVMGVVFSALGFGVDPEKSEDFMSVLVILGAKLTIRWTKKALSLGLDDGKMRRWMAELDQVLLVGVLTPALAMKFVGRFLWAASLTADKVGKSNLKALMAQIHDPTRGYKLSAWAGRPLVFWRKFLLSQPQIWKSVDECKRQHMISWTDAAGTGELAALLYDQRRDTFVYTTLTCPPVIMDQWLRRGDDYIGLLGSECKFSRRGFFATRISQ